MPKPDKIKAKDLVKTTIELPEPLWREAKIRALDERSDFRAIVMAALEAYLKRKPKGGST